MEPSNVNAVYWSGYDKENASIRGNNMGDTERGTKAWMEIIKAALKGANPPAVPYMDGEAELFMAVKITDFAVDADEQPPAPHRLASQP